MELSNRAKVQEINSKEIHHEFHGDIKYLCNEFANEKDEMNNMLRRTLSKPNFFFNDIVENFKNILHTVLTKKQMKF
jgi:hypothetical protein